MASDETQGRVLIIGGGIAGLAAAKRLKENGIHVLVLERRPDERDAQLVAAVVDSIGDTASADATSWPFERQRQLIQHCLDRLDVVDAVLAPSSGQQP